MHPQPQTSPPPNPQATLADIQQLVQRAEKGDQAAQTMLREVLQTMPHLQGLLDGNLSRAVQNALLDRFGKNPLLQGTVRLQMDQMRTELRGANPSAMEHLLVERIVLCWLHLHQLEITLASHSGSVALADFYQRCIDRAQGRYLASLKALATLRKLALPTLHINIAKKQIHVAGSVQAFEDVKPSEDTIKIIPTRD